MKFSPNRNWMRSGVVTFAWLVAGCLEVGVNATFAIIAFAIALVGAGWTLWILIKNGRTAPPAEDDQSV